MALRNLLKRNLDILTRRVAPVGLKAYLDILLGVYRGWARRFRERKMEERAREFERLAKEIEIRRPMVSRFIKRAEKLIADLEAKRVPEYVLKLRAIRFKREEVRFIDEFAMLLVIEFPERDVFVARLEAIGEVFEEIIESLGELREAEEVIEVTFVVTYFPHVVHKHTIRARSLREWEERIREVIDAFINRFGWIAVKDEPVEEPLDRELLERYRERGVKTIVKKGRRIYLVRRWSARREEEVRARLPDYIEFETKADEEKAERWIKLRKKYKLG